MLYVTGMDPSTNRLEKLQLIEVDQVKYRFPTCSLPPDVSYDCCTRSAIRHFRPPQLPAIKDQCELYTLLKFASLL
jgi:hypothetical protein